MHLKILKSQKTAEESDKIVVASVDLKNSKTNPYKFSLWFCFEECFSNFIKKK